VLNYRTRPLVAQEKQDLEAMKETDRRMSSKEGLRWMMPTFGGERCGGQSLVVDR